MQTINHNHCCDNMSLQWHSHMFWMSCMFCLFGFVNSCASSLGKSISLYMLQHSEHVAVLRYTQPGEQSPLYTTNKTKYNICLLNCISHYCLVLCLSWRVEGESKFLIWLFHFLAKRYSDISDTNMCQFGCEYANQRVHECWCIFFGFVTSN